MAGSLFLWARETGEDAGYSLLDTRYWMLGYLMLVARSSFLEFEIWDLDFGI
jgi:hypothetical protein